MASNTLTHLSLNTPFPPDQTLIRSSLKSEENFLDLISITYTKYKPPLSPQINLINLKPNVLSLLNSDPEKC